MSKKIKVVFFQRKPYSFNKSIEAIFSDIRARMPDYILPSLKEFSYYSKGFFSRLGIIWEAYRNQGDINHVTGDIHFAAIGLSKHKTILTVHDLSRFYDLSGLKLLIHKLFWFTLPLRKCRFVTVNSKSTKNEFIKFINYPPERIHIIHIGISSQFKFSPKPFNKSKPIILQIGTTRNKNIERLIEAISGIPCQLNIIGVISEPILSKLEAFKISYSNFVNLSQAAIVQQYINCDIVSFVSTHEGFGMPIVEANATGRPVITSNILSMPEIAGNAACLVDPYDIKSISNGILRIINDDNYRESLIQNGLENCKRFDPQKIADEYLRLYKQIAEQQA
jgi:glycosyltransferase involved in cell wall biosynthesis